MTDMYARNAGSSHWTGAVAALLVWAASMLAPSAAHAQSTDGWEVNVAPLYLWASELSGEMSVNRVTTPVFMNFGDAVDHLSGIFTFHGEARKGRWGVVSDLGFVRLSSQASVTVPGLLPSAPNRTVTADVDLANTIFEAGASYLVSPARDLSVIGGLRTYTLAPQLQFTGGDRQLTPVDTSETSANAFVGVSFRPELSEKWILVTRVDAGGGTGFTWSGTAAMQFQFSRHSGVLFGYHALGVDTGEVGSAAQLSATTRDAALNYHMTHYGPIVALNLRWGGK